MHLSPLTSLKLDLLVGFLWTTKLLILFLSLCTFVVYSC
uniref:Uncharacterized protein n=1 Tax=Rhizophora mucronata TaxID=61149 RepID=A0A2P2R0S5_RHIMU